MNYYQVMRDFIWIKEERLDKLSNELKLIIILI